MDSRSFTFLFAVFSLAVIRLAMYLAKRRGHLFLELAGGEFLNWRPSQLVLASFLTLFAEFAFIRWIAVEVHVFAYFKNLALLLCFVGFGLGCALAEKKPQWIGALTAFLGLPLLVRLPAKDGAPLEALSQNLGGGRQSAASIFMLVPAAATLVTCKGYRMDNIRNGFSIIYLPLRSFQSGRDTPRDVPSETAWSSVSRIGRWRIPELEA